ncbi:MAG: tautomerase family protein, partial [Pseudomonadota bacterium]
MPLAQISMRAGKPPAWRRALLDGLYDALREAMDVPEGDRFAVLHELPPENFDQGPAFGIERSQDLVYIRIALFDTRPVAQKQALFRALVDRLGRDPGLRPEDVFI